MKSFLFVVLAFLSVDMTGHAGAESIRSLDELAAETINARGNGLVATQQFLTRAVDADVLKDVSNQQWLKCRDRLASHQRNVRLGNVGPSKAEYFFLTRAIVGYHAGDFDAAAEDLLHEAQVRKESVTELSIAFTTRWLRAEPKAAKHCLTMALDAFLKGADGGTGDIAQRVIVLGKIQAAAKRCDTRIDALATASEKLLAELTPSESAEFFWQNGSLIEDDEVFAAGVLRGLDQATIGRDKVLLLASVLIRLGHRKTSRLLSDRDVSMDLSGIREDTSTYAALGVVGLFQTRQVLNAGDSDDALAILKTASRRIDRAVELESAERRRLYWRMYQAQAEYNLAIALYQQQELEASEKYFLSVQERLRRLNESASDPDLGLSATAREQLLVQLQLDEQARKIGLAQLYITQDDWAAAELQLFSEDSSEIDLQLPIALRLQKASLLLQRAEDLLSLSSQTPGNTNPNRIGRIRERLKNAEALAQSVLTSELLSREELAWAHEVIGMSRLHQCQYMNLQSEPGRNCLAEAKSELDSAIKTFESNGHFGRSATLKIYLAAVSESKEAQSLLEEAMEHAKESKRPAILVSALMFRATCKLIGGGEGTYKQDLAEARDAVRQLLPGDQRQANQFNSSAYSEAFDLSVDKFVGDLLSPAERSIAESTSMLMESIRVMWQADQIADALGRVRVGVDTSGDHTMLKGETWTKAGDWVTQRMSQDRVTLILHSTNRFTIALALGNQIGERGFEIERIPFGRLAVQDQIKDAFDAVRSTPRFETKQRAIDVAECNATLQRVGHTVLPPLVHRLLAKNDIEIEVISQGALGRLPMSVWVPMSAHLPVIRDGIWPEDVEVTGEDEAIRAGWFVGLGIEGFGKNLLASLENAEEEVRFLAAQYSDERCELLIGSDGNATLDHFSNALSRASRRSDGYVVHLATHGNVDKNSIDYVLQFQNSSQPQVATHSVGLVAQSQLPLKGCQLAILGSCKSHQLPERLLHGNGVTTGTEWLRAGCQSVLVGSWELDDDATSQLVRSFGAAALGEKASVSPEEALRDAMELIRGNERYSHPYYWAGMRLMQEAGF